jgi:hypothetical protein
MRSRFISFAYFFMEIAAICDNLKEGWLTTKKRNGVQPHEIIEKEKELVYNTNVLFPVRYELNLYMLCRRK